MEYTIMKLSKLAGISTRTLRYYDEINLLKPIRMSSSGYRIYGLDEVKLLQQILFYRELGVELSVIKDIINAPGFNRLEALREHAKKLAEKQKALELLINNVNRTIQEEEGEIKLNDAERFAGLKKQLVDENEVKYGKEIREKYGDQEVDESNDKILQMDKQTYQKLEQLGQEIIHKLEAAVQNNLSPDSEAGQNIAAMHKEWLGLTWKKYNAQAHAGLGQMYVSDERFTAHYDKNITGCAAFLNEAIQTFVKDQ